MKFRNLIYECRYCILEGNKEAMASLMQYLPKNLDQLPPEEQDAANKRMQQALQARMFPAAGQAPRPMPSPGAGIQKALMPLSRGARAPQEIEPGKTYDPGAIGATAQPGAARRGPPPVPAAAMAQRRPLPTPGTPPPDEGGAAIAAARHASGAPPALAADPGETQTALADLRAIAKQRAKMPPPIPAAARRKPPMPPEGVDIPMDWVQTMDRLTRINEALSRPFSIGKMGKMNAQKKAPKPKALLPKKTRRGGAGGPTLQRKIRGRGALPARQ